MALKIYCVRGASARVLDDDGDRSCAASHSTRCWHKKICVLFKHFCGKFVYPRRHFDVTLLIYNLHSNEMWAILLRLFVFLYFHIVDPYPVVRQQLVVNRSLTVMYNKCVTYNNKNTLLHFGSCNLLYFYVQLVLQKTLQWTAVVLLVPPAWSSLSRDYSVPKLKPN